MMGILCTEQSCRNCKYDGIIYDPFHSDMARFSRGALFVMYMARFAIYCLEG